LTTFIETKNVQKFQNLALQLLTPDAIYGPSLGAVVGTTGRGKTTAAKRLHATIGGVCYLRALNFWSTADLLREMAFLLKGERPRSSAACAMVIADEVKKRPRVFIVDEADRLKIEKHIEPLRGVNESCGCPIIFSGEERLVELLQKEKRVWNRVCATVSFIDIAISDLFMFWKKAVGLTLDAEVAEMLFCRAGGDFRIVAGDAINAVKVMNANNMTELTKEVALKLPVARLEV
jgi:hypothetical protein